MDAVEGIIIKLVQWLRLTVEATGAFVIAVGAAMAIYGFGRALILQRPEHYVEVRLTLARYLALAIECELAVDILSTAIAPSWDQIRCNRSNPHRTQLLSHARNERGATERRRSRVIPPFAQTFGEFNYECACN